MCARLLIVDDSNIIRRAIAAYSEGLALSIVATASDGQAALDLLEQHQPDLVTMDITMPNLDGLSCLQEIMSRRPNTRVLIVSALSDRATGLQALKLGAAGFLPKPFTREQLRDELLHIMGEPA
ncbi:MAG: response regulator [Spirochaetaceae bacterium]|nr:MAG: response regulator [Spirochaetaceae bacterium]